MNEEARQQEDARRQEEEAAKEEEEARQQEEARRQKEEEAAKEEAAKEERWPTWKEMDMEEKLQLASPAAQEDAVLRRQQDLEDDKERVQFLRRPGLLSRVLVDHDGWQPEARPGGVDLAIAYVASAVAARRMVFEAAKARSNAEAPATEEREYLLVMGTSVLARHLQHEAMDRVDQAWRQTPAGQIYVQKARDTADQAAKVMAEKCEASEVSEARVSASTPGRVGQRARRSGLRRR